MKRRYFFLIFILSLLTAGVIESQSDDKIVQSVIISNEGGLIDSMVAAGYGTANLYTAGFDILGTVGGDFWNKFRNHHKKYTDIYTKKIKDYAGSKDAIAINADGSAFTITLNSSDYHNKPGYKTFPDVMHVDGREIVTYATSQEYFIDIGSMPDGTKYKAIAIAWSDIGKNAGKTVKALSFILSDEAGRLISEIKSSGYADSSIYSVLLALRPFSGGAIRQSFLDTLKNCPAGSQVHTKTLGSFTRTNSIAVNSDGTVFQPPFYIRGSGYKKSGFTTILENQAVIKRRAIDFTENQNDFIFAGSTSDKQKEITTVYQAFGIAYNCGTTISLTNEEPGYLIDSLISQGYGQKSVFEALKALQAGSAGTIPAGFIKQLEALPQTSDVHVAILEYFGGLNNPVCINSDGWLGLQPIFGRDFHNKTGFKTHRDAASKNQPLYTYAVEPAYFVDAGSNVNNNGTMRYLAFLFIWSDGQKIEVENDTALTFMLSNEAPGYLIDNLIANGYGDSSLYSVMVALQPVSGGVIRRSFLDTLKACPAGSEIFTGKLKYFTGLNNPVGINYDGTILLAGIYGRHFYKNQGYSTVNSSSLPVDLKLITSADSPEYLIDTGEPCLDINKTGNYKAFAVAWSRGSTVVISNEAPGYLIDTLIAKGYGNKNLFDVISALQPVSGGSIPDNYIKQLAALPQSSEIFTSKLYEFAGNNNPVCINADGKVNINPIYAKGYDQKENYTTCRDNHPTIGRAVFTYAISHEFYIDAGFGSANENYRVFTIVWSDNVTSIQEHNEVQKSVRIYPNPFSDGIYISNLDSPARIEIYDILGRNAYAGKIECDGYLALPGLTDGIYWISISSGRDTYQQILVKNE